MARIILKSSVTQEGLYRVKATDISHWEDLGREPGGTRDKKILRPPHSTHNYLTKFPEYGEFEITSEIFNSILAKELGIKHVSYYPVIYRGRNGVACRSFIASEGTDELWEMKDLICRHSHRTNLAALRGRDDEVLREHSLQNIVMILESEFGEGVLPGFFAMIGFDALLGHGDRHWSNYGVVVSENLSATFSPIYDTASGYLTEITDHQKLTSYLANELRDDSWYRPPPNKKSKGLCKITLENNIKCNHFDLLEHILMDKNLAKYHLCLRRAFDNFNPTLPGAILNKFFPHLDNLRCKIIETVLKARHRIGRKIIK